MKNVWEAVVVGGVAAILMVVLLPFIGFIGPCTVAKEPARRNACSSNLSIIAKACVTYQESNGSFYPAFWDGTRFDPMKSLALLYPDYIDNLLYFMCPSTKDWPEVTVTVVGEKDNRCAFGAVDTDKKCSYFYDELTNPRKIGPNQAIACDADGQTWRDASGKPPPYPANWTRKPRKPNHENGQNVMYFDGHVKWTDTNYASADPRDNIFCPTGDAAGPWDPDTDAYLWDGVNTRAMEVVK